MRSVVASEEQRCSYKATARRIQHILLPEGTNGCLSVVCFLHVGGERLHLPMEELLVTEQPPKPVQPTEFTLALSFLREDIQDIRQDVRQIHERIDQTNERINDLAKQLDSRYARLMAMLIACTGILVTTMGAAVAVLK